MTCIVGLVAGDRVLIGGDSAGARSTNDWVPTDYLDVVDPKVFTVDGVVYGHTSSFRLGQLLRYRFRRPPNHADSLMAYLCGDFVDALRTCFREGGFGKVKDAREEEGGVFLFGYMGHLFEMQGEFSIVENRCGYAAVGCGANYAKGSLFSTHRSDYYDQVHGDENSRRRVLLALEAAEAHSAGVRGPFHIETIGD